MKILCVCKQGIVRSGALAWLLKTEFGHDAVSVGYETNGREVIDLLCAWATAIIVLDDESYKFLPLVYNHKSRVFDIGEDRWHDPSHPELHAILRQMIKDRM